MKNIQISFEDILLHHLDNIARVQQKTRSAVIREAVANWIKQSIADQFESDWINSLKNSDFKYADEIEDAEAWMAAETWDSE